MIEFSTFIESSIPLKKGTLLIAAPLLNDPYFVRSVIFICEHNNEGTIGFVINKEFAISNIDFLGDCKWLKGNVYNGGPMEKEKLHLIHRLPELLGGEEIISGYYWGGDFDKLEDLLRSHKIEEEDYKLFLGYAGWEPGQLEEELNMETWIISNKIDPIVFERNSKLIWRDSLNLLGPEFKSLTFLPPHPQLN